MGEMPFDLLNADFGGDQLVYGRPTFPYFRHSFFQFWTLCDALGVVVKRARF